MTVANSSSNDKSLLPTLEQVINLYLWGREEGVSDKTDENILQLRSKENITLNISIKKFIKECGSFINAKNFPWIDEFFNDKTLDDVYSSNMNSGMDIVFESHSLANKLKELYPKVSAEDGYTRTEILTAMGYYDSENKLSIDEYQFFHHGENETETQYEDRSFIWASTQFRVNGTPRKIIKDKDIVKIIDEDRNNISSGNGNNTLRFCIYPDGRREIKNFSIIPRERSSHADDDFDFDGGTISNYTNSATEKVIDPSGIGRTVNFKFVNDLTIEDYSTLTVDDYHALSIIDPSYFTSIVDGKSHLENLIDRLWNSGTIKFLDNNNRPIIYGSGENDEISGTVTLNNVDISQKDFTFNYDGTWYKKWSMNSFAHLTQLKLKNHLSDYVNNGIHYIAGNGNDKISGTQETDLIKGGKGDDLLIGLQGNDILIGGEGNDILYGGNGDDILYARDNTIKNKLLIDDILPDALYGGAGKDILYGDNGNDILYGGDIMKPSDGEADQLYGYGGYNTFIVDHHDTIQLTDKADIYGAVYLSDGQSNILELKEATHSEGDPEGTYTDYVGNKYTFDGNTLVINNGLRITDFKKWAIVDTDAAGNRVWSALGITIRSDEEEDASEEDPSGTNNKNAKDKMPDNGEAEKVDPVVIDMDGNGVETLSGRGVHFDYGGDGVRELSGWAAASDGFLVRDLNGDGKINNGRELFGNHTLLQDGSTASNGFQALLELDDNQDGIIDAQDKVWSSLQIWQDKNSNGETDDGELVTLSDAGVAAIDIRYASSTYQDTNGEAHRQTSTVKWADGRTTVSADVWFKIDQSDRVHVNDVPLTTDVIQLPNARGFGNVSDLREAMAQDDILKALVTEYIAETDSGQKEALLDKLIYQWAGVQDVAATRLYSVTAQQVALLEQLTASSYNHWYHGSKIAAEPSTLLLKEYQQFRNYTRAQLLAQTTLYDHLKDVVLTGFNSGVAGVVISLEAAQALFTKLYQAGEYALLNEVSSTLIDLSIYSDYNRQKLADLRYTLIQHEPGMADYLADDAEFSPSSDASKTPEAPEVPEVPEQKEETSDNFFTGGDESESLFGDTGANTLSGGKGSDYLCGGEGDDTYLFNAGDGQEVIFEYSGDLEDFSRINENEDSQRARALLAGQDTIRFGQGLSPDKAILTQDDYDLVITFQGSDDSVTVKKYFYKNEQIVESLIFADGTIWNQEDVAARALAGTEDDQFLMTMLDGSEIHAAGGDDTLEGRQGNDVLYGDEGNDAITGGSGDDILSGGAGDDVLQGGHGNDIYLFNKGDGHDYIFSNMSSWNEPEDTSQDTLRFGEGIRPEEVQFLRDGDSLIISVESGEGSITIEEYFSAAYSLISRIEFADGTFWDTAAISAALHSVHDAPQMLTATEAGGVLEAGDNDDSLYGLSGDDELYGMGGNDRLNGGEGNDFLSGGEGSDTYTFNAGDGQDIIEDQGYADQRDSNTLYFGEGLLAENAIVQRSYDDLLITFKNSDDSITISNYFLKSVPTLDSINFSDGTTWNQTIIKTLTLSGTDGDDNLMAFAEGSHIDGGGGNDSLEGSLGDDYLDGGEGNDWLTGWEGNDMLAGGAGDDELSGWEGNDILYGGAGDDQLYGDDGNDTLAGGEGNDTLSGGTGSDTYLFNAGDGQDFVDEWGNYSEYRHDTDTIRFGRDLRSDAAIASRQDDDLIIAFPDTGDSITLNDYFYPYARPDYRIVFADGAEWDYETMRAMVLRGHDNNQTLTAFEEGSEIHAAGGDDTLIGDTGDDILHGDDGNDTLYGNDGDDLLSGGAGNDTLCGGYGEDTYLFNAGDGQDHITSTLGEIAVDTLHLGDTLLAKNTLIYRSGNSLVISFRDSTDSVTLTDYFSRPPIARIVFADGTTWDCDMIENQYLLRAGTDEAQSLFAQNSGSEIHAAGGNDTLNGGNGDDALYGDDGDDTISGAGGSDTLYGGNGNDMLAGGAGDDLLAGNAGNDTLKGDAGRDTLYGDDGDDALNGGEGNDWLSGGAGNDHLDGGKNNDQLSGGAGNDSLLGGYGSDIYLFSAGDGQDVITEGYSYSGDNDTLRFGDGTEAAKAIVQRNSNDLLITFEDSTDSVTVKDYFSAAKYRVEHITFADGTDWLIEDVLNHIEDDIPLPLAQPADAPVSLQKIREQMAMFTADSDNDDDCVVNMSPSLSTARTTVNSLMSA